MEDGDGQVPAVVEVAEVGRGDQLPGLRASG